MSKRWRPAAAWRRALETFRSLGARLEAWGEREVRRRAAEARTGDASGAARKERYAVLATVAGFSISGVLVLTAIALEVWLVFERPWTTEALPRFALYGAAIAAISVTELVVTMRFALWLAGRQLGRSSIHTEGGEDPLFGALARAVTGAPEPDLRPLELDCRKFVNRRARLAAKLAWRSRRLVSNVIAKTLLRQFLGRSMLRAYSAMLAAPITGLWGAWAMFRAVRVVRFRLTGRRVAEAILAAVDHAPADRAHRLTETMLLLVAGRIVQFGQYDANLDLLATGLAQRCCTHGPLPPSLDDWSAFVALFRRLEARERMDMRQAAVLVFALKARPLSRRELAWLTEIGIAADDVHRARRKITSAAPLEIPVFAAAGRPGQPMRDRHTDGEAPPVTAPARIAPPTCGETARPGRSPVQRQIGHHLS